MSRLFQRRKFLSALGIGMVATPLSAQAAAPGRAPAGSPLKPDELRDRFEIRELLERYSHTVDFMDWEQLDTVFTQDATVDYSALKDSFGDWPYFARGMAEIRRLYEIVIAPNYGTLHHMSNHLIALYGDEARVRTYMHVGGGSAFGGLYLCGVVRTAAGWRIRDYSWVSHTRSEPADAERVRAWMRAPSGRA
jgi:hypothetical protein